MRLNKVKNAKIQSSSLLAKPSIQKALGIRSFLKSIEVLDSVDSTNSYGKRLLLDGVSEATMIVAEEQTQGRGRFGRTWEGEKGKNLTFSLVVSPGISQQKFGVLPLLTELGVADAVASVARIESATKWPNDLLIAGKKVCGILLETVSSRPDMVVIGVGLNVNQSQFSPGLNATSLSLEHGKPIDRLELLVSILHRLDWLARPLMPEKVSAMLTEWQARCSMMRKSVRVEMENGIVSGFARGIADDGALLLVVNGTEQLVHAGEVTILST